MRHEPPASGIRNRRNCFLPSSQPEFFRLIAPPFDNLAATVEEHHLANPITDEHVPRPIESNASWHKARPDVLQIAFTVENLNTRVIPIADVNPLIRPNHDGMRQI